MTKHKTGDRVVAFIQILILVTVILFVFYLVLLTYQFGEFFMRTRIDSIVKGESLSLNETISYTNEVYGYRFQYPVTWDLSTTNALSRVEVKDALGNLLQISLPAATVDYCSNNILYQDNGITYAVRDNLRVLDFSAPVAGNMIFQCNNVENLGLSCDDVFKFFVANFHFLK